MIVDRRPLSPGCQILTFWVGRDMGVAPVGDVGVLTHTLFSWDGSTATRFLQFCTLLHFLLLCVCLLSPSLSCCCFKHDTGYECDWLMIGCSALSPASLAAAWPVAALRWCRRHIGCGSSAPWTNTSQCSELLKVPSTKCFKSMPLIYTFTHVRIYSGNR